MASTTNSNIWPQSRSDDVVQLIELYLQLVDSKESSAGPRLADEVFAKNGKWFAAAGLFEGHGRYFGDNEPTTSREPGLLLMTRAPIDSIASSRLKAWDTIDSQKHRLLKVFLNDADGLDLLVVGEADAVLKNSERLSRQVIARAVVIFEDGQARIKFWQALLVKPSSEQPILADVDS